MKNIRIDKIKILNYKGIDEISVSFSLGKMKSDPDINILGSKNGIGKTSILECCALILLAAGKYNFSFGNVGNSCIDLIRSGAQNTKIVATISVDGSPNEVSLIITKDGNVQISGEFKANLSSREGRSYDLLNRILGRYPDPVSEKFFFFLHSYRKIQEGKPELGMMLDEDESSITSRLAIHSRFLDRDAISFSLFKRIIVRNLMEEANLFERVHNKNGDEHNEAPQILNDLLKTYANVQIGKLRPYKDNTIDVTVEKISDASQTFSIDGLSSGQKEIISTLFLIWNETKKHPSVVMIDEPELHLNAQWHSSFVKKLLEIAPNNQYILATHAEAIMASVEKENRILLSNDI